MDGDAQDPPPAHLADFVAFGFNWRRAVCEPSRCSGYFAIIYAHTNANFEPGIFCQPGSGSFQGRENGCRQRCLSGSHAVDPENPSNYVELARIQAFTGDYEEGSKTPKRPFEKSKQSCGARRIGLGIGFPGEYVEAERSIRRALEIDPNNALAHAYYAEFLSTNFKKIMGCWIRRYAESKLALEFGPDLLETHRARGIVLLNTNNLEEAVQEFEKAISLNKNIADLHLYLGLRINRWNGTTWPRTHFYWLTP